MDIKDKVAVVTGGSRGYGKGIAWVMKNHGSRIWILSSNEKDLQASAKEIGVSYAVCDITKPDDWDNAIKKILEKEKNIDILINNAGAGIAIKNLIDQTDEEIYRSIMINLVGHIYGIRRIAKLMIDQKNGIIINISSVCADHGWPGWSIYSAAKAGIEMLARCLHNEFRKSNVKITTLTPSWGSTNFLEAANLNNWMKDIIKDVMQPEQMGELIARICMIDDNLFVPKIRIQPMVQEINPM